MTMADYKSILERERAAYQPKLPSVLWGPVQAVEGEATQSVADQEKIKGLFPSTYGMPVLAFEKSTRRKESVEPFNVGVILSGGQAPGGHNVICGLFDALKALHPDCRLYGFLMGPSGLVDHDYKELTKDIIDRYRNTGGFDMIGSGRTKLEKVEQFEKGLEIIHELNIRGLVIIGGDDSNTNAAMLAEYYKAKGEPVQVVGCPKTIDGDLKNAMIEISFGFDTATKVYGELIGNIERDCNSSRKYWHFIKLMGRSASHIALECALQTRPNYCIISEEVEARNMTLGDVADEITEVVISRAEKGMNFGTVLVPEGLIEFIPTMKDLMAELNQMLIDYPHIPNLVEMEQNDFVRAHLSEKNREIYDLLPDDVARQLSSERDAHGNVQMSQIETEQLLSRMVGHRLEPMIKDHTFPGKFKTQHHFLGYEGRCAFPSNFDADYCYALGYNAVQLINCGATGYMSSIRNLSSPSSEWLAGGVPITMMMNIERRNGEDKPVIRKSLVDLYGRPFQKFAAKRGEWAIDTCFVYPGPVQFFGPSELCDQVNRTLYYELGGE